MFLKLTKQLGKPICVLLYSLFGALAAKKKPLPLIVLLALHTYEYFHIGQKTAKEHSISVLAGLANCLAFGFTWWLPITKE